MIGEATVNIKQLIEDSSLIKKPLTLNKKFYQDVLQANGVQMKFEESDSS